jgi:hypothetical protein
MTRGRVITVPLCVKSGVDPLSRTEAEAKIDHAKDKVDEAIEGPRTPCIGTRSAVVYRFVRS